MVVLPLLVLVVALVLGVPIAVALAGSGMLGIYLVTGDASKVMGILSLAPFSTVADYALTTIPMFILMAFFSASSGLARDLYAAASNWCSHIKGGLAIATVFACGVFGAMSGASTAAASVMSKIAMPEMRRHGYSDELAAGAIGIGATLDILIPPSIPMVIYGIATQTSIGKLLIAGVVPGIVAGILLAVMVYLWVVISPKLAPSTPRLRAGTVGESRAHLAEPAAHPARVGAALHRHRDADGGGRARRLARRRNRRGVRPPHLRGGDRRREIDHPHLGDDFSHPARRDHLRLLHGAEPHSPGGGHRRRRHEPQSLGGHYRHRGGLFHHQHVHG